jgi:hypothetical protein
MKIIETIGDVQSLPLSIKTELSLSLISPFGIKEDAERFWQENDCFLMMIEPSDSIESLDVYDRENGYWLDFITTYPEHVLILGDDDTFLLALAITSDTGSGGYLLIPLSHISSYKSKLKTQINNQ